MPVRTLNELYAHGLQTHAKPRAFLTKCGGRYREVSSEEFAIAGREIALGLIALGLAPGDRVAVLSPTRLEWSQVDMGILTAGLVSVPIYPNVTQSMVEYIVTNCGAKAIVVADSAQAAKTTGLATQGVKILVIQLDGEDPGVMTLATLRERGRALGSGDPELYSRRTQAVQPDDLATIIYTSGTTGMPKGVMLSHHNIVSNVLASLQCLQVGPDDTSLSFLPLSHILERMAGLYIMVLQGACIGYAESIETVAENLREVHPTVMVSVPRLYEKMYVRILDAASTGGGIKKQMFFWARRVGLEHARAELAGQMPSLTTRIQFAAARRLVFSKLKQRTGGRLRFFVSGGAPLSKDIAEFFYAAGLPILEGYGLTESSPVIAVNTLTHLRLGSVGRPIPGVEVKIADDGEILARGPNIMLGYYDNPQATAEAIQDGWLMTGDIGHLDRDGYLVITDRKKDILVTAGGKNVAPQPIENRLKTDRYLSMAVVLGDRRPCLVALLVPNFEQLERYARGNGIDFTSMADLVQHPRIHELLRQRLDLHQKDLARYEQIKEFHVLDRELTVEAGELTPTLKVRRKEVAQKFASEIEALFSRQETSG